MASTGDRIRVAALAVFLVLGAATVTSAADTIQAADAIHIVTAARSVQPGEVVVFTATAAAPIDARRARACPRALSPARIDSRTCGAVLGIDLDVRASSYPVSFHAVVDGHDVE